MTEQGGQAGGSLYQRLSQETSRDDVISEDSFDRIILTDILNGHNLSQFRQGLMTLMSLGRDGRTAACQKMLIDLFREIGGEGRYQRRAFSELQDALRKAWRLRDQDPVLSFVRDEPNRGVAERDFVEFVTQILTRAFDFVDRDRSGCID